LVLFDDELGWPDWVDGMQEKGRHAIDGNDPRKVCARCFNDDGIGKAIELLATAKKCDFCERLYRSEKAAPITEVAAYIMGCLLQDYDIPENVLFIDDESENGWAGTTYDRWELVQDYLEGEWEAIEALVECVTTDTEWCEADPGRFLPGRQLGASWDSFSRYVKHRSRFMFVREDEAPRGIMDEPDDSTVPTTRMLDLLGEAVVAAGLLRTVKAGTRVYRARPVKDGEAWHTGPGGLGPPPISDTGPPAGRMNPAGIPILYGALTPDTALQEALESDGRVARGVFSPLRPLAVLDLSRPSELPRVGIFDNVTRARRGLAVFLSSFIGDIARTTERDGREHIDYVPAQIVTEYFRRVFRTPDGGRLDGIVYPSTRDPDGRNVALFLGRDDVRELSNWGETLRFHPRLTRRFNVTAADGVVTGWTPA
jgi:hypothetical protein